MGSDVPAVRNASAVLKALAGAARPLSAGALARATQMPRSSTYQLLAVLVDEGLVTHVGQGYALGPGVYELGSAYLRGNPLQRLAQPIVAALADAHECTAQLAVLRGWETVYLLKERSPHSVAIITDSGVRMPSYLTATGRAIMSGLPTQDVLALLSSEETFVDRTGRGPRNWTQLKGLLAEARRVGWSVEDGEISPGVRTVAAPVRDAQGRPVAALGMSVGERVSFEAIADTLAPAARDAAERLSARLA